MKLRPPLDLGKLRVRPLSERRSLTRAEDILLAPDSTPSSISPAQVAAINNCAQRIREARKRDASVMLIYGAHLLRNGAAQIIEKLLAAGWITHLATNGAGSIHDWEYAWCGASTEGVEENVAKGTFGSWHETATCIHAALMCGALEGLGYGASLGRFISENGTTVPAAADLAAALATHPYHPLSAARADLLHALHSGHLTSGPLNMEHRFPHASILAAAWRHKVSATIHPGIGYDIISNHPIFNGSVLGRAGEADFKSFAGSVEGLDGGVVLSVGSAVMGPQVFEKTMSCVNNLRLQEGRPVVQGHSIDVVDLQDGGDWDWSVGEPPKTNPAYYLRFCKSFSRMGAPMRYLQCDNAAFMHNLLNACQSP